MKLAVQDINVTMGSVRHTNDLPHNNDRTDKNCTCIITCRFDVFLNRFSNIIRMVYSRFITEDISLDRLDILNSDVTVCHNVVFPVFVLVVLLMANMAQTNNVTGEILNGDFKAKA